MSGGKSREARTATRFCRGMSLEETIPDYAKLKFVLSGAWTCYLRIIHAGTSSRHAAPNVYDTSIFDGGS